MNRQERISAALLALLALLSAACASADDDGAQRDAPLSDGALTETSQNSVSAAAEAHGHSDASDLADASALQASPEPELDLYLRTAGLEGMYNWDPAGGLYDAVRQGTLVVKPPCVFIDLLAATANSTAADSGRGADEARVFLRLPKPLTHYDYDSGAIWVGDQGPMSSGDLVEVVGSVGRPQKSENGSEFYEGGCSAQGSFRSSWLQQITGSSRSGSG